jgi:nitroimidazol reductase NimA-like FMN-containing flavoprotein (pyridoxamine 5'-phosphate oxidase superfamily)
MNDPLYERPMRRAARRLPPAGCLELLRRGEWGVLALCSEGQPYGVPLNYVLREEGEVPSLLFHCAPAGLKLDILDRAPRACFTVVPDAEIRPENLTTRYESVMIFGTVRRLEGEEHADALRSLGMRFSRDFPDAVARALLRESSSAAALRLDVQGMTGKFNPGG